MKTIILLLLAASIQAQITIEGVTPSVLCGGDTIYVKLRFKSQGKSSYQINLAGNGLDHIWSLAASDIKSMPIVITGSDTLYNGKIKTLPGFPSGDAEISTDWVNGIPLLFSCNVTGIEKHDPAEDKPVYFDLYGNRTGPTLNTVLIEQRGINRRKIIIQ